MAKGDERMSEGVGAAEDNTVSATRKGLYPSDNTGGDRSQGEVPGAGSLYAAQLNERPNISNPRNQGPERAPSRIGSSTIPVATLADRKVDRL